MLEPLIAVDRVPPFDLERRRIASRRLREGDRTGRFLHFARRPRITALGDQFADALRLVAGGRKILAEPDDGVSAVAADALNEVLGAARLHLQVEPAAVAVATRLGQPRDLLFSQFVDASRGHRFSPRFSMVPMVPHIPGPYCI